MHPLQTKIRQITRRAQQLRWRYAVACFVAIACSVVLAVGATDFLLRFRDMGLRVIGSLLVCSAMATAWWRFIGPVLSLKQSDVSTAQHIERAFPRLSGQLSSAIAFLEQDAADPKAGSLSLRRAVVASAEGTMEQIDWQSCLKPRRSRRAMGIALGTLVTAAVLVALQPQSALLAARRLVFPWQDNPWPRRHVLVVEAPVRLAAGDDFEVSVRDDNGLLPERVEIEYWPQGDPAPQRAQVMDSLKDKAVHRLVNVSKSFRYRVRGGDDDTMDWIDVEVVLRPRVSDVKVTLTPPTYSGLPQSTVQRDFRALAGSSAVVAGKAEEGTKTIRLQYQVSKIVRSIQGDLSRGRFTASDWTIDQSGSYWFELTDARGLMGGDERKWEIRAIPDVPPTVSLRKAANEGFTTAAATIPLDMIIKDDLAIRSVDLNYVVVRRAAAGTETSRQAGTVSLYKASTSADGSPARATSLADGDKQTIQYSWNLRQLANLEAGDTFEFAIVARDFKSQAGKSASRKWVVISAQDYENRIAQRQSHIISSLAEVLRTQRQARSQTAGVQIQWTEGGDYGKPDLDRLQSSELAQRQIAARLGDQPQGIAHAIRRMITDLRNNGVDNPDVYRRLNQLLTTIRQLRDKQLPAIRSSLTSTLKQAREQLPGLDDRTRGKPNSAMTKSLAETVRGQDSVIEILESLVGDLSQWDNYRRFAREIAQVARDQEQVAGKTQQLMLSTLTGQPNKMSPAKRASVRQLGQRQRDLARRFERIQSRMERVQAKLADEDPLAAATMADAIETARRMAISGQMREGGRHIEQARFSRARDAQAEVKRGLEEILDTLANRRELELDRIQRQLEDAASRVGGLRARQKKIDASLKAAKGMKGADRRNALADAAKSSKQLADDIEKMKRQLKRLEAEQAAAAAARAAGQASAAAKAAAKGRQADAEDKNRRTGEELKKVEQAIGDRQKQVRRDLVAEQFARLEQLIEGLRQRQANLSKITGEIESLRKVQGRLKRSQALTVQGLASQQQELATETTDLADQLTSAAAFQLSLQAASKQMFRAASGLNRAETSEKVQMPQEAALQRLDQLLQALKQQNQPGSANQTPPGQGGKKPSEAENNRLLQLLAQLRLARLMQQSLHQRTVALEQIKAKQGLTDDQKEEYRQLAEEQGKLADIFYNLIQAQTKPDLEQLPGGGPNDGDSTPGENGTETRAGRKSP